MKSINWKKIQKKLKIRVYWLYWNFLLITRLRNYHSYEFRIVIWSPSFCKRNFKNFEILLHHYEVSQKFINKYIICQNFEDYKTQNFHWLLLHFQDWHLGKSHENLNFSFKLIVTPTILPQIMQTQKQNLGKKKLYDNKLIKTFALSLLFKGKHHHPHTFIHETVL